MEITLSLHDPEQALEFHQWQIINLNLARFGFTDARFRIVGINDQNANDSQSYQFTLKEDDASSYDYIHNFQDLVIPSYRSSNLVGADYVPVLTGLTILSGENELKVSRDGTVQSRILVSWDDPQSPYVFDTQVEFKTREDDPFHVLYTGLNELYIPNVEDNAEYTIRAAHRNTLGVVGPKFELTHIVEGKTALPDTPISVVFIQVGNQIKATMTGVESRDLASVIFRGHYLEFGGSNNIAQLPRVDNATQWEEATLYGQIVSSARNANGSLTYYIQLAQSGYYVLGARTVDTSGNLSAGVVSDTFTYVNQIQRDNLFEIDYAPDFSQGTLDGLVVGDDVLLPAGFNSAENETRKGWNNSYAGRVFSGQVNSGGNTPIQFNGFSLLSLTSEASSPMGSDYGLFDTNKNFDVVDSGTTNQYNIDDIFITRNDRNHTVKCNITRQDGASVIAEDEERILNSGVYFFISRLQVIQLSEATITRDGNNLRLFWFNRETTYNAISNDPEGIIPIWIIQKTHNIDPPSFVGNQIAFNETKNINVHWAVNLKAYPFEIRPTPGLEILPINKESEYEFEVKYRESSTSQELTAIQTDPPTLDANGDEVISIPAARVIQPVLKLKYQTTPTLCRSFYVRVDEN